MAKVTFERHDKPTPHGGAYSIAFFQDDDGKSVSKDKATRMEIVEYNKAGADIYRTYGVIEKA